jgi:hypothetical protein
VYVSVWLQLTLPRFEHAKTKSKKHLEEFFERMLCLRFLFFVCVCEERGGSYVYVCLFCLCIVSSLCAFVMSVCVSCVSSLSL